MYHWPVYQVYPSDSGLSGALRLEPDSRGGDDHHRPVVDRALLVAGGQPTPLFEPIDAALHDVAPRVDGLVEDQRASRSSRSPGALIAALGDGVRDPPAA